MSELINDRQHIELARLQKSEDLLSLVYEDLRRLAASRLSREQEGQTLQPTALVHEAWLAVTARGPGGWENQAHFFAAAAEAMRRILVDRARRKHALKRGAGSAKVELREIDLATEGADESVLEVNEALTKLEMVDSECAELIKLRFFAGLNYKETAQALGVSERTSKRYWTFGRAWLCREIQLARAAAGTPIPPERSNGDTRN